MSADNIDISDIRYVTATLQGTYDTLNLALEFLAGTDSDKAREIFNNTYLLQLFQLGSSLIKQRQKKGQELADNWIYPLLDYPELLFVDSLLENPPALYLEANTEEPSKLLPLVSITTLNRVDSRLSQIEALQKLFSSALPFKLQQPEELPENQPTLAGIFLTAVANRVLGREFTPVPLVKTDLPQLKEQTFSSGKISTSFGREISQSMQEIAPNCDFFVQFCLDLWEQIFQATDFQSADNPVFSTLLITPEQ
jgi:hypothetical protein